VALMVTTPLLSRQGAWGQRPAGLEQQSLPHAVLLEPLHPLHLRKHRMNVTWAYKHTKRQERPWYVHTIRNTGDPIRTRNLSLFGPD
jgi:hypothetical protein